MAFPEWTELECRRGHSGTDVSVVGLIRGCADRAGRTERSTFGRPVKRSVQIP